MGNSLAFHAVIEGECQIEAEGTTVRASAGDVVLVPHGRGHLLRTVESASTPNIFDLPHDYLSERYAVVRHGTLNEAAAAVTLVCGAVECDHPAGRSLLAALPSLVHVAAPTSAATHGLASLIEVMGI